MIHNGTVKIDFDGIQAFVVTAELGGFNKAAEQLHITQTALTRRVQKLEAYLGLKLLDRTTRRVEMTAVGRDFLPQARAIVNEMTSAVERLKDMSQHAKGNFTLACVPSMAAHMLPQLIRQYADICPGNRIRLLDAASYEVRQAVLNHQAEIGIAVNAAIPLVLLWGNEVSVSVGVAVCVPHSGLEASALVEAADAALYQAKAAGRNRVVG